MNRQSYDHIDAFADRSEYRYSHPVQPTDDADAKPSSFSSQVSHSDAQSIDSGIGSLRLSSVESSSSVEHFGLDNAYRMDYRRRGHSLIINNRYFDRSTGVSERTGTDLDAANMYTTFKKLGFEVDLQHNKKFEEMLHLIISYSSKVNHDDCDCFVVVILSHGDEGEVYGTNGSIALKQLIEPLKACKSLLGKPKLFFIQACQGNNLSEGVDVTDAEPDVESMHARPVRRQYRIPQEADFLIAYSTTSGTYAFRNNNKGSWFIQALSKVFLEQGTQLEITRLLTRVNRIVAEDYESRSSEPGYSGKKQMPCFVSMLRKDLYFKKK